MPIAWHPSRWWDCCMSEEEKKRQKNSWDKQDLFVSGDWIQKNF